jgi:hypothetical protein
MKKPYVFLMAATLATVAMIPVPRPAQADTGSTLLVAGAAAMIVGALLVDSHNQPYYVSGGRHIYVSQNTAVYYRAHYNHGNHYGQYQNTSQQRYAEHDNNNQHHNQDNHGYQQH